MTAHQTAGGFAGAPDAALRVAGPAACCGSPAQSTTIALPDPADTAAEPCCGTAAAAEAANACCAPAAKADAVAAAARCCG